MSAFSSRTTGYKAGVYLLFLASVAYLVGYAAPYWASADLSSSSFGGLLSTTYHEGIWMLCITVEVIGVGTTTCGSYGLTGFPAWFQAVRVLQSVGVIGTIASCIYALVKNCCSSFPGPRSRALEILTGVTGVISFAGCMVYVGLRNDTDPGTDGTLGSDLFVFFNVQSWDFAWAFYLAAVGSALRVLAAVLIGVGNKPVEGAAGGAGMVMTSVPPAGQPAAGQQTPYAQPYAFSPPAGQPSAYAQPYAYDSPPPQAGYPSVPSYPNYQGQKY